MTQQTAFVGIDVAAAHLDGHILPEAQAFRGTDDAEGLTVIVGALEGRRVVAELEASGGYERLALHTLLTAGHEVRRVNPSRLC